MTEKIPLPSVLSGANSENKDKPKRTVQFVIGGQVKSFDRDTVKEDYRVEDIVRMQPEDFPNIDATPGSLFLHLNLRETPNRPANPDEPERKYLIVKIVGPGQPEPLLTPEGALLAECVDAKSNVPYDELTDELLALSLPGLKDRVSALATMQKRYGASRGLSPKEVEDAGVGYTIFRILGPAPASNVVR